MKVITAAACFVLCLCLAGVPRRATAHAEDAKARAEGEMT